MSSSRLTALWGGGGAIGFPADVPPPVSVWPWAKPIAAMAKILIHCNEQTNVRTNAPKAFMFPPCEIHFSAHVCMRPTEKRKLDQILRTVEKEGGLSGGAWSCVDERRIERSAKVPKTAAGVR